MKIDQMQMIPLSLDSLGESQFLVRGQVGGSWILLSAESRIELSEAFVIFIVILLTQFPPQHRYTDTGLDLRIAKIPYKAIPATGVHRGKAL